MCHRKTVSFYCHCPLRNTARCLHSAYVNWDEYSNPKTTPNKATNNNNTTSTTSVALSSQPPGFPPSASPATATPSGPPCASGPPQNQNQPQPLPPQNICPKTRKPLFFHPRRPQDPQGAVHWDPLPSQTKWFPCAGYIATHTTFPGWPIPLHECEDCPEYFGDGDVEEREVGVCEGCRGGHQNPPGVGGAVLGGGGENGDGNGGGVPTTTTTQVPLGAQVDGNGVTASEACSVRITKRGQRVTMLEILPRSFSAPEVGKKE